jgi:hypothetical protein
MHATKLLNKKEKRELATVIHDEQQHRPSLTTHGLQEWFSKSNGLGGNDSSP